MIDERVRHIVEAELESKEKLLWAGKERRQLGGFIFTLLGSFLWLVLAYAAISVIIAFTAPAGGSDDFISSTQAFYDKLILYTWVIFSVLLLFSCLMCFLGKGSEFFLSDKRLKKIDKKGFEIFLSDIREMKFYGSDFKGNLFVYSNGNNHVALYGIKRANKLRQKILNLVKESPHE